MADRFLMCYGSELTSTAILRWSDERCVGWHYIAPGKPQQNAYAESFNAVVRLECLGQHWFLDLDDAREKVEALRRYYAGTIMTIDPSARSATTSRSRS